MIRTEELRLSISPRAGEVTALLFRPATPRWLLVLGHGAGAGMRHHFLESLAECFAGRDVATLRYEFPYREKGRKLPDPAPVLQATVRAAVNAAGLLAPDLPLLAGGKSMGGRMTSLAASEKSLHGVRGLVFFGFPLHPIGHPGTGRAEHLSRVGLPMLFLQGTRDRLADLELLRPVVRRLGPAALLQELPEADHDFNTPARWSMDREQMLGWLVDRTIAWADTLSH
jgi:predicted alpha/beta-hydrolase family hydrolase